MSLRALLWKDAMRETRGREGAEAAIVLVALFFLVEMLAAPPVADEATAVAALWIPLIFVTGALVGKGFASEADRGTLELLRSAPVPAAMHGLSRTLVDLALVALVGTAALAFSVLAFGSPATVGLVGIVLLAVIGLTVVGSFASGVAAQARSRELLLPVLMVPVLVPLIEAGIGGSLLAIRGASATDLSSVFLVIAGYDLVMGGLAWILWPHVLEAD
ncbi:MAG: heme exporter protein CcmB [Euryarchaeota archaeon]|nr:heme exporter protein CcmB [Euryarchaeota archaeon]